MSTHNVCFGAKIRKIGIPLHTPVLLYKKGVQGGYTLHGYAFVVYFAVKLTNIFFCQRRELSVTGMCKRSHNNLGSNKNAFKNSDINSHGRTVLGVPRK